MDLSQFLEPIEQQIVHFSQNPIKKTIKGIETLIPVRISAVVSDMKAQYEALKLKVTFGWYFKCRTCGANYDQIQSPVCPPNLVDDDEARQAFESTQVKDTGRGFLVGINGYGRYNTFAFDVAHDLPEGVVVKLLGWILMKMYSQEQIKRGISLPYFVDELSGTISKIKFINNSVNLR